MGAGVDDRRGRLRREQHQDFLVRAGELGPAFLLADKEVADRGALFPDRRSQNGPRQHQVGGETERANVGGQVAQPQRRLQLAQVLEEPRSVGPGRELAVLVRREPGGDEVLDLPGLADGRDQSVAGADQRAGAVDDLLQDGVEVEAGADAHAGRAQPRDALPQRLVLAKEIFGTLHGPAPAASAAGRRSARPQAGHAGLPEPIRNPSKSLKVTINTPNDAECLCEGHEE